MEECGTAATGRTATRRRRRQRRTGQRARAASASSGDRNRLCKQQQQQRLGQVQAALLHAKLERKGATSCREPKRSTAARIGYRMAPTNSTASYTPNCPLLSIWSYLASTPRLQFPDYPSHRRSLTLTASRPPAWPPRIPLSEARACRPLSLRPSTRPRRRPPRPPATRSTPTRPHTRTTPALRSPLRPPPGRRQT